MAEDINFSEELNKFLEAEAQIEKDKLIQDLHNLVNAFDLKWNRIITKKTEITTQLQNQDKLNK